MNYNEYTLYTVVYINMSFQKMCFVSFMYKKTQYCANTSHA